MLRKTLLLTCFFLLLSISSVFAQGEVIQFLLSGVTTLSGGSVSGGYVYSYTAGTTTPKAIYTTRAMTTSHDNPAQLDTDGRLVAYGEGMYKFIIKDAVGNTLFTVDNVEIRSTQDLFDDPTDPFGETLTQTNLTVENLSADTSTLYNLTVTNSASIARLTIGNTPINGVATATLATQATNLGQVRALIAAVSTSDLMAKDGSNASTTVTLNNLTTTGTFTPAGGVIEPYAKYHRVATMTLTLANTWTDVEFDYAPGNEYSFGFPLLSSSTIEVASASLVQISGCIRPRWTGAAATVVTLASRVVYSTDSGVTWNEARCLQAVEGKENGENEVGTVGYHGSIKATAGTRIKLQYRATDVQMLLAGWPVFDNPVAATISLFTTGL